MKKTKKTINWILIMMITIFTIIFLSSLFSVSLIKNEFAKENNMKKMKSCSEDIEVLIDKKVGEGLWQPILKDETKRAYCLEPSVHLKTICLKCKGHHTLAEIKNWETEQNFKHEGCNSTTYIECVDKHYNEKGECVGKHYNEESKFHVIKDGTDLGEVKNLYDVGYILSLDMDPMLFSEEITWSGAVQQAIWMSPICKQFEPTDGIYKKSGENIRRESLNYKDFYEKIEQTYSQYYEGKVPEDKKDKTGMKPMDLTEHSEIKIDVDQEHKTNKIGPFKIDYVNGYYKGISFGGISNMYLKNNKGDIVPIKALIRTKFEDKSKIDSNMTANDKVYKNYNEPRYFTNKFYDKTSNTFLENKNKVDYYAFMNYYPEPKEEFYVEIEANNVDVTSLTLHVDFKWVVCKATMCLREGYRYDLEKENKKLVAKRVEQQDQVFIPEASREYEEDFIEIPVDIGATNAMKIGGFVFEDTLNSKENKADGVMTNNDIALQNIEVALYDAKTNQLAKLAKASDEMVKNVGETDKEFNYRVEKVTNDPNDYTRRINPTLTDANGYYEFRGINVNKKYYVKFTYNGQEYMPTEYLKFQGKGKKIKDIVNSNMVNNGQTIYYDAPRDNGIKVDESQWKISSKGTEKELDRKNFDARFFEIGSYPLNYKTTNSLKEVGQFNKTFSEYDLAGFELNKEGNYIYKSDKQLVDTYLKIENGNIINTKNTNNPKITEGIISKKIKEYVQKNHEYPQNMKNDIYIGVVSSSQDTEIWNKLQFIEDCKISSFTKNQNATDELDFDVYPVFDKFTTSVKSGNEYANNSYSNGSYNDKISTYENHILKHNGNGKYGEIIWESNSGIYPHTEPNNDVGKIIYPNIYKGQLQINQGLWKRQKSNLSINKDVAYAATKINDKTEVYEYNKRKDLNLTKEEEKEQKEIYERIRNNTWIKEDLVRLEELEKAHNWSIQARIKAKDYYVGQYNRALYPADYNFIGQNTNGTNNSKNLEVYLTYKITLHNSSQGILNNILEVVDYYHNDYIYMDNLSWVMYENEGEHDYKNVTFNSKEYKNIIQDENVRYEGKYRNPQSSSDGKYKEAHSDLHNQMKTVYINGLKDKQLESGENAYIYLTFKVDKNNTNKNQGIKVEDVKCNYAEINGYTTHYQDGTFLPNYGYVSKKVAGLIDYNSTPGNLDSSNINDESKFEDDTDRAKGMQLKVQTDAVRSLNGIVWEDERKNQYECAWIGDGIRQTKEIGINGVRVQLVEKLADGKEYIWGEIKSGVVEGNNLSIIHDIPEGDQKIENGVYNFKNFIPGNYVVRFIYGENDETVKVKDKGGLNITSYNGQDFKSTIYQKDGAENKTVNSNYNDVYYNIQISDDYNKNLSDAKDIYSRREDVINYSKLNVKNATAEILASPYEGNGSLDEFKNNTYMIAETALIVAEGEYNRTETDGDDTKVDNSSKVNESINNGNGQNTKYKLNNIDLGLVERPKAQLELNKKVNNVKITLMNGSVLFDAKEKVDNLLWINRNPYDLDLEEPYKKDKKYKDFYRNNHGYAYRTEVNEIVEKTYKKGLVQATMDDEQMHGATIQITYEFYVKNVGEVDYNNQDFYYMGTNNSNKVTTTANTVIDYVANNLKYDKNYQQSDNTKWNLNKYEDVLNNKYLNETVKNQIKKYNTIITTNQLGNPLLPGQDDKVQLTLTQLITPQNKDDELTYKNIAEIVEISNDVGRRMAYSIQGNQDPTATPAEVDSFAAEDVKILPPYGMKYTYYVLGIAVATILIAGVVLIKKKVLK